MIRQNQYNNKMLYNPDWRLEYSYFVFCFSSDKKYNLTQHIPISYKKYTLHSGHWQNEILQNVTLFYFFKLIAYKLIR